MNKKGILLFMLCVLFLTGCGRTNDHKNVDVEPTHEREIITEAEGKKEPYIFIVNDLEEARIDKEELSDFYITNIGDSGNLYTIDNNHVLWGCGYNRYGQLGQGVVDDKFYENPVKIAEDVIHVDYSQKGYVIFLKKDGTLYGMGNNGTGALTQLNEFSYFSYLNGEKYAVSSPRLIMSDVAYARCGREDVVTLKSDASAWTWGVSWYNGASEDYFFRPEAEKIADNVRLVTGGFFNHAILKEDGTVWTWGYNLAGSCGIDGQKFISKPQQVAENVKMVWTGQLNYNVSFKNISEADEYSQRALENTIIQKNDGSFWACGINIGETSKVISPYYELMEFETVCTNDFYPCIIKE